MMTANELLAQLDNLYMELEDVKQKTETEVCRMYNADDKADILQLIGEEIDALEMQLEETKKPDRMQLNRAGFKYGLDFY